MNESGSLEKLKMGFEGGGGQAEKTIGLGAISSPSPTGPQKFVHFSLT